MNPKKNFISNIFLQLSVITATIFLIWHKTLNQGLWGDGFYWFNPLHRGYNIFPIDLNRTVYNPLSRKIFDLIIPIFREKMVYYQLLQIIFLIILTITIYFVTLKLTKKTIIAFSTCLIFVSNSGGLYEMMAEGNLNRFLDRVPNLIIVIAGIYFLANFIQTKKIRNLIFSWIIYVIGIYLGHFSSFVLPFYMFFVILCLFNLKRPIKSLLIGISIALIFAASNFVILQHSDQRSGYPFSYYLDPQVHFVEKTFLMTTPLVIPREIVINLAKTLSIRNPYVPLVRFYTIVLIILSIAIGYFLYRKNNYFFRLYVSCILTMLAGTALIIYTDPIKFNPYKNFGADRSLFVQSIFYSIILSTLLDSFLGKYKKISLIATFTFLAIFAIYNVNITWQNITATQYLYVGNNKFFAYFKQLHPKFNSKTVVILGSTLMHACTFLNDFYGPPEVIFASAPGDIQEALKTADKNNTYLIDVNYNPTPDGYYLPERVRIDDFTDLYRRSTNLNLVDTWGTQKVTWFESLNNQK